MLLALASCRSLYFQDPCACSVCTGSIKAPSMFCVVPTTETPITTLYSEFMSRHWPCPFCAPGALLTSSTHQAISPSQNDENYSRRLRSERTRQPDDRSPKRDSPLAGWAPFCGFCSSTLFPCLCLVFKMKRCFSVFRVWTTTGSCGLWGS